MREETRKRIYDKTYGLCYLKEYTIRTKMIGGKETIYLVGTDSKGRALRAFSWMDAICKDMDGVLLYEDDYVKLTGDLIGILHYENSLSGYFILCGEVRIPLYQAGAIKYIGNKYDNTAIQITELTLDDGKKAVEKIAGTTKEAQRDYVIYTDGGCSKNPGGYGGYGVVVTSDGKIIDELFGGEPETTNNQMELLAVIHALEYAADLHDAGNITLYSDSQYVVRGISEWMPNWRATGWKNGTVKNLPFWKKIDELMQIMPVTFQWIRGHNGDKFNERADELATAAYKNLQEAVI